MNRLSQYPLYSYYTTNSEKVKCAEKKLRFIFA